MKSLLPLVRFCGPIKKPHLRLTLLKTLVLLCETLTQPQHVVRLLTGSFLVREAIVNL
jgi:hypothetical protein